MQGNGTVSCVLNLTTLGAHKQDITAAGVLPCHTEVRCLVAADIHEARAAPWKRTCRSMPLCIKVHFESLPSCNGFIEGLGAPDARVVVDALPHVENKLHIKWRDLGTAGALALGNVSLQYLSADSSVPATIQVKLCSLSYNCYLR